MNISNIINWIKLSPKYIIPIALLASLLVFLPDNTLSIFGVNTLSDKYRMWIGLICLSSYALLLTHLALWIKEYVTNKLNAKRSRKETLESLRDLSPEEKVILSDYILLQTKSQQLDIQSGVTNGLEHAQIIYRAAGVGTFHKGFAYNIQPWAWEELNKNPDLLEPILSQRRKAIEAEIERRGSRY